MLKLYKRYSELNVSNLLSVYEETILRSPDCRFQAELDFCEYLKDVFFSTPGAYYAVWCQEDRYLSALRVEPYHDGYLLSALETAPRERRRGFAAALTCAVCEIASPVYSHVHRANHASLRLHKNCGFVEILDYGILLDGTVSNQYVTLCYGRKNPTSD